MYAKPFFIALALSLSYANLSYASSLQNGDLVFVSTNHQGISAAIDSATNQHNAISYDHVGLVAQQGKRFKILHADEAGSRAQQLSDFVLMNQRRGKQVYVYRLKDDYQYSIAPAIQQAKRMLGKPYNFSYILNEQSYYCSDFIERAFRQNHIFALQPMNFKNLKTGLIDDYWLQLYRHQGLAVPQDQPGTNPNDLSKSDKLELIGQLRPATIH
jgi:cell wall-associated NlpC family hydrolase